MSKLSKELPAWQLYEFDKPHLIASYFGFLPIETPRVRPEDLEKTSDLEPDPLYNAAEKAAFLRAYNSYVERELGPTREPLGFSYRVDSKKSTPRHSLELVGYSAGLAEALLIRASLSILLENGHRHLVVDINCIGDKESINTYEHELHNFLRKSGSTLPPDTRKEFRKDIFNLIRVATPETETLRQNIPSSIAFLSPQSRNYFKEVLEHIESLEIEFRLNPELVGHKNFCSHTIFSIKDLDSGTEQTLAYGYCYPRLSKRFGFKKELPLMGANIFISKDADNPGKRDLGKTYKRPKPKFYLVQLGREAKMKSISIIELLRRERIAVYHVLSKDKITAQLAAAESLGVPYLIIIGHKEALDNTATIRNISSRAQDTVPLTYLPNYLKSLPI